MKKIIKAHKGYMHVSKPSSEQAPSKAKGTAGATPRRRMIGLPQQFRSGRGRAPMPQAPAPVRRAPAMQEPKVITQPKPTGNPFKKGSHNYEVYEGRGGRPSAPVKELPNKGRGKNIRMPKPQVRSAQATRTPMVGKPIPRIMNQGGYMSRAKYGQVDNLKKGK